MCIERTTRPTEEIEEARSLWLATSERQNAVRVKLLSERRVEPAKEDVMVTTRTQPQNEFKSDSTACEEQR